MAKNSFAGHTTRPSRDPASDAGSPRHAAIRWVHPSPKLSLLSDGHTFGRDSSCDTVLDGPEVSRQHARVQLRGFVPALNDVGSRNGVSVNGAPVAEYSIGPGDVVRLGDWVGVVVAFDVQQPPNFALMEIFSGWYGSAKLSAVADAIQRVAPTQLPVVIEGKTGTGKEGLARALHTWSGRKGAFVAVDCGALSEQLAEGELFGYRKGAFTGAAHGHDGYFRAAEGGTLFLDEIVNLPLTLQVKLLRVLERGEVVPLGHTLPCPVNVRIVCAAQEALQGRVDEGQFRADLLARVDGLTVSLPPLRDRREDILPLFQQMLANLACEFPQGMEPRVAEALLLYDWPLNVRELLRLAERVTAMYRGEPLLQMSMLPTRITSVTSRTAPQAPPRKRAPADDPDDFEALVVALRENGGSITRASKTLGMSRSRVYRVIDAHPELKVTPRGSSSDR